MHKMIVKVLTSNTLIYRNNKNEEAIDMLKLLAKVAERYAKSTNTACWIFGIMHQPTMPASLIKED